MSDPSQTNQVVAAWEFLKSIAVAIKKDDTTDPLFPGIKGEFRVFSFNDPSKKVEFAELDRVAKVIGVHQNGGPEFAEKAYDRSVNLAEAVCYRIKALTELDCKPFRLNDGTWEQTYMILEGKSSLRSLGEHGIKVEGEAFRTVHSRRKRTSDGARASKSKNEYGRF